MLRLEYYDSNLFSVCQPATFNLLRFNNMNVVLSVGELLKDNVTKISNIDSMGIICGILSRLPNWAAVGIV